MNLAKLTIAEMFRNSVEKWPNRPSLSWADEKPYTFHQLSERVEEVSSFLKQKGIIPGDRIAILSENSPNWGISYFSIVTMGAIVVPILPEFHENEIAHILRHSGAKAIFVSSRYFAKIEDRKSELLQTIILIDDFSIIPPETTKVSLKNFVNSGKKEFAKIKNSALQFTGLKSSSVEEDDVAAIVYTSGTTGHSKGVMLTHKNLIFNALDTLNIQNMTHQDKMLSVLPLPHTYEGTVGFILPFMCGTSIYYLKKPPTASVLLPAMQKIQPTMILTVPLIMEKIFKAKIHPALNKSPFSRFLYAIPAIRKVLHKVAGNKLMKSFGGKIHFFGIGGALLCPEVERFMCEAKFPYAIGYGLTETSPLIAGCTPSLSRYRSTGFILPGIDCKLLNKNEKTGEGEIVVKSDSVMKGYYKDPERTAEVFTEDGYFKTGDLGVIKDKYLYIKGRLKNVIVGPSGENIYPEELEAAINENDMVLESLVYDEDKKIISRIHLDYEALEQSSGKQSNNDAVMRRKVETLLNEIRKNVNSKVSSFSKLNKVIEQTEPFERTPTKKIKRYLYTS